MEQLLSDDELQEAIAGLPEDGVTQEYIVSRVRKTEFHRIPDTNVTVCTIHLDNGFTLVGHNATYDQAHFVQSIGERCAYDSAMRSAWKYFAFLAAEGRYRRGSA